MYKKNWELVNYDSQNQKFLELSLFSEDLDSGYPGNLNCNVKYSLNDSNEFKIEFFANSDADDMYAAIDLLADKIDRQLLKQKEKT